MVLPHIVAFLRLEESSEFPGEKTLSFLLKSSPLGTV